MCCDTYPKIREGWIKTAIAVILPFAWILLVRLSCLQGEENSFDCYYHVRMAESGPKVFAAKTFPKLSMSVWEKNFSDKELLFHTELWGLFSLQKKLGFPVRPPFHFPALLNCLILLIVFALTARYFGVRNIFLYSLLTVMLTPFFNNRIMMLRPHVLWLSYFFICCVVFHRIKDWKWIWSVFLLSFISAWLYSNPHFLLMPAFAFAIAKFFEKPLFACLMPVLVATGIAAGYTLHPQFPNTFIIWKIQCVDVICQIFGGRAPVELGSELNAPSFDWLKSQVFLFILGYFNVFLFIRIAEKKRRDVLKDSALPFLLMSIIPLTGVFFSKRAAEYACPLCSMATGVLAARMRDCGIELIRDPKRRKLLFILICVLMAPLALYRAEMHMDLKSERRKPLDDFSQWLDKSGIPKGTLIGNIVWTHFPMLYYSCPEYRFLSGLDPMFTYARFPGRIKGIEKYRKGKLKIPAPELRRIIETRYVFVMRRQKVLGNYLKEKMKLQVLYEGPDGWLFDLDASPPMEKDSIPLP